MKKEQDYIRDITEIRTMMERSSKFLSLSGWAGIMAGIFALAGAYLAYGFFNFNPDSLHYGIDAAGNFSPALLNVIYLAVFIFLLALISTVVLSVKKAAKRQEKLWNPTSRQLLYNMAVLFIASALLIFVLLAHGLTGLLAPFSLVFYGIALFTAGQFTYKEVRILGLFEITLGLFSAYFMPYGLICWALGFGVAHIIYGIFMHYKYER